MNILKKHGTSFLLGGAFFLTFYYFLTNGPSPDPNAIQEVKKFRKALAFRRGHGVAYDTTNFLMYLSPYMLQIDQTDKTNITDPSGKIRHFHTIDTLINGVKKIDTLIWEIGFYWKMKTDLADKNKVKHDFCMIPTLIDTNRNPGHPLVFDYFEDINLPENKQLYNHKNDGRSYKVFPFLGGDNAYDNGQLWP